MTCQQYRRAKKAGMRIGFQCPAAIPVEADFEHYNPDNPLPVLTELLAPTVSEDDSDMYWQSNPVNLPPVLTDHASTNGYGLAYIPEADADQCMQPIEDPLPSRLDPYYRSLAPSL